MALFLKDSHSCSFIWFVLYLTHLVNTDDNIIGENLIHIKVEMKHIRFSDIIYCIRIM